MQDLICTFTFNHLADAFFPKPLTNVESNQTNNRATICKCCDYTLRRKDST